MSINNLCRKKSETIIHNRTYKIVTTIDQDPYWDEGFSYYYPKGVKNHSKAKISKLLLIYQVRMYRTWKYNRKTQWK